ncbi:hypothetical protein GCM10027037_11140 [Mucilaginibacter koreensis]
MKKSVFFATLALAGLAFKASDAQVRLHIGFNFGTPVYAPAPVADVQYSDADDYYYLPDADAYYCVPEHVYYFMNGSRWVSAPQLPGRFRDFDWRSARRYEIRGRRPFLQHDVYRSRYNGFAGGNPNWRSGYDNRFERDGFAHRVEVNRGWGRPDGGFDRSNRDYNRSNRGYDRGNRGGYNGGGYDNTPNQQPQGGYNQGNNGGGWNRGNQGQQGGQYNQGQPAPQPQQGGQYNQGGNWGNGQQGGNHNWGGQQGGQQQGDGQYGRPSNNQGGERGNNGPRQRFADSNGPNYNRQNGMFRQRGM